MKQLMDILMNYILPVFLFVVAYGGIIAIVVIYTRQLKNRDSKASRFYRRLFYPFAFSLFFLMYITVLWRYDNLTRGFVVAGLIIISIYQFLKLRDDAAMQIYFIEGDDYFETQTRRTGADVSVQFEDIICVEKSLYKGNLWVRTKDGENIEVYSGNLKDSNLAKYLYRAFLINPEKIQYTPEKEHAAPFLHRLLITPSIDQKTFLDFISVNDIELHS